ncbi:unnamed protein product [Prunus armeniaca]
MLAVRQAIARTLVLTRIFGASKIGWSESRELAVTWSWVLFAIGVVWLRGSCGLDGAEIGCWAKGAGSGRPWVVSFQFQQGVCLGVPKLLTVWQG